MKRYLTITLCLLLAMAGMAYAQTTVVSVQVAAEASLTVPAGTTMTTTGTNFSGNFTGTTALTYKIRTTASGGSGHITALVTADFTGNGPSVATPNGSPLTYTCGATYVGTPCGSAQTASTSTATTVIDFGTNAKSHKAGDGETLSWSLPDDPQFETGNYSATVTFTISAT